MTIENLKQIAIKYATTKGSRVPLAPDELCNAVVQYMNSFFGVMTDINTIKVAVTEDSGNIVFTITGNTYDGKPITPIVITVDHNDFVTDQEFEAFKTNILDSIDSLNNSISGINNTIKNINDTLENKVDVIKNPVSDYVAYVHINHKDANMTFTEKAIGNSIAYRRTRDANFDVSKGTSGQNVANMENIADVEAKIPAYTTVNSVSYDTTNGAIIAYDGAHEIHIPLQAGENVTIDASEDNKKIVISAAGGGGAGDVTASGNNTFTGENTFTNEITFNTMKSEAGGINFGNFEFITENGYYYSGLNDYQFVMQKFVGTDDYYETIINADLITYKPVGNNVYEFHFPNKSGTFAMTNDIIKESIYFISFYANEPSEPCHLIGTMMSENSYGTGQKTNEEFAVMLADNLYTNSNEGLAAYGKLANKDILCIYSDDGLSIRCLDEENREVDLPTVMFFVMETEL